MIIPPSLETVHEMILKPDVSRFCVCFCIEERTPSVSWAHRASNLRFSYGASLGSHPGGRVELFPVPVSRAPRLSLAGWASHSRLTGCSQI